MGNETEFIPAVMKIMSHFQRIGNQRMWDGIGDMIRHHLGYPPRNQTSDSIKAHFISFYYKRRLREIKKVINDHRELFEENIGFDQLNPFIKNIDKKLNSKNPDLFKYYDEEDEDLKQFFDFLQSNYGEYIKKFNEIRSQNFKRERQILKKAAKSNPNQNKLDF